MVNAPEGSNLVFFFGRLKDLIEKTAFLPKHLIGKRSFLLNVQEIGEILGEPVMR